MSTSLTRPRLVGVGMGPGDPELVTMKAVRVLREADVVLVPVMGEGVVGRAETTVASHVGRDTLRRVVFALNDRDGLTPRRESAWDAAADAAAAAFADGAGCVAFATIGDPNVYSTFTYLAHGVRERVADVLVETIPGITAMQDLAARSGVVLCEGRESLALMPLTAGLAELRAALEGFDTVVAYKGGARMADVVALLAETDRLDGAVYGAALGLPEQDLRPAAAAHDPAPYLSTVIVPARRTGRGGRL